MPTINTADGTEIFYEDTGSGKPLVLIHGWPLSSRMWEHQFTALPQLGIRCIAYDRRGFGQSDHPAGGFDFDTLSDDLKSLFDALDLHDVTLAGFSMGGGEVARYMSRHGGHRVARTVLISAITPFMLKTTLHSVGVDESVFSEMRDGLTKDRPAFLTNFAKKFFGFGVLTSPISDAMLAATCEDAMRASPIATLECVRSFSETDFRADLAHFKVPNLIIHGDNDQTVPLDVSGRETKRLIPGSEMHVYSGAPHGLFVTERNRLNADLSTFVLGGRARVAA